MTAVIQKLYASRARFHSKASQIKQFVRHHEIDGDLRKRIEDWFISYWSVSKGLNTEEVGVLVSKKAKSISFLIVSFLISFKNFNVRKILNIKKEYSLWNLLLVGFKKPSIF